MSDPKRIWWCEMENLGWGVTGINSGEPHCVLRLPEETYFHGQCGWRFLSVEEVEEIMEISEEITVVVDEAMIDRAAKALALYWWETGGEWGSPPEPNDDDWGAARRALLAALEAT